MLFAIDQEKLTKGSYLSMNNLSSSAELQNVDKIILFYKSYFNLGDCIYT